MNIKRLLLLYFALVILGSCKKAFNDTSKTEKLENLTLNRVASLATEDPDNNFVAVTISQSANLYDTTNSYKINVTAKFTSNGQAVNTGPIQVNGRNIYAGTNNIYRYNYGDSNTLAEGKSMIGSSIEISATGVDGGLNRIQGSSTVVVPKALFPTTYYYPKSTIDKASSLPLVWVPDPNNQYQKVNIEVTYYKGLSQANDPNLQSTVTSLWYQVADNGSFTIPQSAVETLPKGGYVVISISRATYLNSSDNFAFIAITEGRSVPILVTDSRNPAFTNIWSASSTNNIGTYGYYSADVNGDGNTDVIQPYSSNGTLALMTYDVSGTNPYILANNVMNGSGLGSANIAFATGDFNKDGKTDFIQAWKNGSLLALSVFKSNGNSISPLGTWTTNSGSGSLKILSVDMDGDGFSDIAQLWNNNGKMGINIFRSTGYSYYTAWSGSFNTGSGNIGIIPCDYDGDGKTDIVQLWNNGGSVGIIVYKSTGSSYTNPINVSAPEGIGNVGFVPVDYNSDRKFDFVQGWNQNGKMMLLLYKSDGSTYKSINNSYFSTNSANLALLTITRYGDARSGILQVYNNNNKTAFIKYWPVD